ncbi:MAG: tRNA pseudouridine(13) synthase TruD [Candidatus Aenigmatarchaeota archaeon]
MNRGELCGMRAYTTEEMDLSGTVKSRPDDFQVEEIPTDFSLGNKFGIYRLEKTNLTTWQAVNQISSKLNISSRRIGYAGLKDRRAITKQHISIRGFQKQDVVIDDDKIELSFVCTSSKPIKSGDLKGNKFIVTIRDIDKSERKCRKLLERKRKQIKKEGIPNFYGTQRFGGKRAVTHLLGKELLKRNYKEAIMAYLTETSERENDRTQKARDRLKDEEDFEEATDYFPRNLDYERKLIKRIVDSSPQWNEDWLKVLQALPKNLRRLFVHAYQSYIFNLSLSDLIRDTNINNFPAKVVGYTTKLKEDKFDRMIKKNLKKDGIEPKDFKFKSMPELSSEGAVRAALIKPEIKIEDVSEDKANPGKAEATVSFSLKPGRYATVVLRELLV